MTNDGTHSYTYDAENRIIQVDGGNTASYVYDAFGRRVRKTVGSAWTDYIYDQTGRVVTEYLSRVGTCTAPCWGTSYIYLGGALVAEYKNGTTYFVHKDHLGSTRLLTKVDQTVQDSMDYLPYGEQIAGASGTTHKFTGKERDGESNLDYFGARYYSSTMGRFMSSDWAGTPTAVPYAEAGDPQSLNLYSYVRNSPIARADTDGHMHTFAMLNTPLGTERPGAEFWGNGSECQEETCTDAEQESSTTVTLSDGTKQRIVNPAPTQGQISFSLGGTEVRGEYSFGPVGETGLNGRPMNGATIDMTAQDCVSCFWIQTAAQSGSFAFNQKTDTIPPATSPMAPNPDGNHAHFFDKPSREQGYAGTFTAVTMLGTADKEKRAFHVIGSITYGYSVDKSGHVQGRVPRVATRSEQRHAMNVVAREFPAWNIN